jgi:hypothetical protein
MGRLVRPIIGCSAETSEWATGSSGGGAPSYTGIVATAAGYVPQTVAPSSLYFGMCRKAHFTRGGITAIQAVWPGYYVAPNTAGNLGLELTSGGYTVSSWVEYPQGTYTQVDNALSVGGLTNTIGALQAINIPAGNKFWFWSYVSLGTFPYYVNLNFVNSCAWTDEYFNIATSGVATAPSASPVDNQSRRALFGPVALIGPRAGDCVALVGDSRQVGYGDLVDASYDLGNCARSIGPSYDYVNLGCGGDRMASFLFNKTFRAAIVNSYATMVVDEYLINDIDTLGSTVAQLNAYKARMQSAFPGLRYVSATAEPVTTSSDSWVTTTNQTNNAFGVNRIAYNDALRLSGIPYFELSSPAESSLDSGKWIVNGVANYATKDGLHASQAASLVQAASATTFVATLAAAAKSSATKPNCNLTFHGAPTYDTSTPKLGTGALIISSTVYAYCYGIMPATPVNTVECFFKSSVINSFAFASFCGIVYANASGFATLKDCGGTVHTSAVTIDDGAWHHLALVSTPTGQTLFVDGVSATTSSQVQQQGTTSFQCFGIGFNGNVAAPGAPVAAEIDEVVIWNTSQYTTTFTPPTSPYLGTEAGLVAVWHMDSNGNGVLGPILS